MSTITLNIIENLLLLLVFIVAFRQLTRGRWKGSRPSTGEELNFDRKQIKDVIDIYLEKPLPAPPKEEPKAEVEPQDIIVPKPVYIEQPKSIIKKKIIVTQQYPTLPKPFHFDIKNAILYEIIFKRKNQKGIDEQSDK